MGWWHKSTSACRQAVGTTSHSFHFWASSSSSLKMKYYMLLARYPALVILAVVSFSLFAIVVIAFNTEVLSFEDFAAGIPSRKTDISDKINSFSLLNSSPELSPVPNLPQSSVVSQPAADQPDLECKPTSWTYFFKVIMGTTKSDGTLLDVAHIKSLCAFRDRLMEHELVNRSCGMISVLDTIQDVTGATCDSISEDDINKLKILLSTCSPFYFARVLNGKKCESLPCSAVPTECFQVYDLFYFYSDDSFYKDDLSKQLKQTLLMFALENGSESSAEKFYLDIFALKPHQSDGITKVVGIDSLTKQNALKFQLLFDWIYMTLAIVIIGIVMIVYLRSIVMMFVAAVDVGLTLILAYFIYVAVCQIKFFPFMNLLGGIVIIALVADDVFLFMDTMENMKRKHPHASLERQMQLTFRHAGLSIFVTSLTTSVSFFSNLVSKIPAGKCFGVYVGLCIVVNFFLMCTLVPATMMLVEKYEQKKAERPPSKKTCDLSSEYKKIARFSDYVFHVAIPKMINTLYLLFIPILLAVGVASAVCVFYKPKFALPDSTFQAFVPRHPMEVYEKRIVDFRFYQLERPRIPLPATYVWGVIPIDTGSVFQLDDKGELLLDDDFDLSIYANQVWLSDICETVKRNHTASKDLICSLTEYLAMVGKCNVNVDPCCCDKTSRDCFAKCFPVFMANLYSTLPQESIIGIPYFNKDNNVKAFVLQFVTDYFFQVDYDAMSIFYNFLNEQLSFIQNEAPEKLEHVYVTSILHFYDTQTSFLNGSFTSVAISLLVCLVCVLVSTGNILITIYSTLNIVLATLGVYTSMILIGWTLNIVESMILSLGVGLAIDVVIHFCIAYLLSPAKTRERKVYDVLSMVGSPTAMAAITTFLAGLSMTPVTAYAYFQGGVFLMLVMTISMSYSIFFFLSLCRFIGPLNNFCQIPCPCKRGPYDDDSTHDHARSKVRPQSRDKYKHPFSGRPIYQVSKGSMYDTIDSFFRHSKDNRMKLSHERHHKIPRPLPRPSWHY